MPAESSLAPPPSLSVGPYSIPYSLISLVTLTVQNSALAILLHYSRTAPDAKPYSAAAAVLLNEILKGSISFAIALNNVESPSPPSAASHLASSSAAPNGRFPAAGHGEHDAPLLSQQPHAKKASMSSTRNREPSLNSEELWKRRSISTSSPNSPSGRRSIGAGHYDALLPFSSSRRGPWCLDLREWIFRTRKVSGAIFSSDCWKLAVPACCYVLQNNLQFVAASNLDVATFQVTYQMKILTTAFFSVTMLNKRLSKLKWACLFALAAGVAIVQLQGSSSGKSNSGKDGHAQMDRFTGFVAVTMACMTSGFAGVYFEKVLKGSTADLWVRNVQLTLFSLLPAFVAALFPEFSLKDLFGPASGVLKPVDPNAPTWLFGNFGGWAMATVFCQVFGGLVTALVIRYSDNIAKGFATSLSIIISFLAGVILFNFQVTFPFILGCSIVLGATYYYNQPESESAGSGRMRSSNLPYAPIPLRDDVGDSVRGPSGFAVSVGNGHDESRLDGGNGMHAGGPPKLNVAVSSTAGAGDPPYPYADYPNRSGIQPKFINLAPFASPKVAPPLAHDVSPCSPVPPHVENSPFGSPAR